MQATFVLRAGELRANRGALETLVDAAVVKASSDVDAALRTSMAAAHLAWYSHPGLFTHDRLEDLVTGIGRRYLPSNARSGARRSVRSVLHVLSEAHSVGGHTRLAWRWAAADTRRKHAVVLTWQDGLGVPVELLEAVGRDRVSTLSDPTVLGRARALRDAAEEVDLVVLHTHPYDVTPMLAFADGAGAPPIALLDHADNVFWLGTSIADLVVSLRASGRRVALERRGVTSGASWPLPSPWDRSSTLPARAEARAALGLKPADRVLLTMASPYKFSPVDEYDFVALCSDVLARDASAHLIAVGPRLEGAWARAAEIAPGRVHAVGYHSDPKPFLASADVYLDSYPFSSMTSLLEAGLTGLPVVTLAASGASSPLRADDVAADPALLRPATAEAWLDAVLGLLSDGALRASQGERLRLRIEAAHCAPGWGWALEELYERICTSPRNRSARLRGVPAAVEDLDLMLVEMHARGAMTRSPSDLLAVHRAPDVPEATSIWQGAASTGPRPLPVWR